MRLCARDLHKRYSSTMGFRCMLRIRTIPDFDIHAAYGHFTTDKNHDNIYHINGCDKWKTFAFDFKHSYPSGFEHANTRKATIQIAFAHTLLPGKDEDPYRSTVERRLRIFTIHAPITTAIRKLYGTSNVNTMLLLLNHKVRLNYNLIL